MICSSSLLLLFLDYHVVLLLLLHLHIGSDHKKKSTSEHTGDEHLEGKFKGRSSARAYLWVCFKTDPSVESKKSYINFCRSSIPEAPIQLSEAEPLSFEMADNAGGTSQPTE